jgi:hypothetical protein
MVDGVAYFALVESYRKEGKVRQRTLYSLGRESNFDPWIARAEKQIAHLKKPEILALAPMIGRGEYARAVHQANVWLAELLDWKARLEKCSEKITSATTRENSLENSTSATTATQIEVDG